MEILHVICPEPADARGGADLHVRDLAAEQRRRGKQVRVLVLGSAEFACAVAAAGPSAAAAPALRAPAHVAGFIRGAEPGCTRIVHAHGYEADLAASVGAAMAGGGNLVMTVHGFLRTSRRMRAKTSLNLLSLRRASALVAAGARQAEELRRRFPVVEHIPNGTEPPLRPRRVPGRRMPRLGFVGRMAVEKRPALVLEVARRLANEGVGFETHLFGGGPLADTVAREAAAVSSTRIEVRGFLEDTEQIYDEIDVLVLTSEIESSPRVVLEAMSRGVAVVAFSVGDLPEILGAGSCGVLAADVEELASGCRRLLCDASHRAALAERARRRWSHHYRLSPMADRIDEIYARVAAP
jgi:glycosyltransferase involved in cell wall biosynthesis